MGREIRRWEVTASVSRHNSHQDELDDALWDEMVDKLDSVVREYESSTIGPV